MAIRNITLKDGTVLFEVYVTVHGPLGRGQQTKRFPTFREAKEGETLMKAQLLLNKGKPGRVTWQMWFEKVLQDMKVTHRPMSIENYSKTLTRWTPAIKNRFLDEITPADIHAIVYQPFDVLPGTRRSLLDMLKRVFAAAVEQGVISKNPASPVRVKVPQRVQKVLNAGEVDKLLQEGKLANHRFYPIWAAALFTGMRSGELYALKWTDINFDSRRIYLTRAWQSKAGYGPTKNQRNRIVPVSEELMKLLQELRLNKDKQVSGHEEYVLPHLAEWTKGFQAAVLRDFCRQVGITSIRFHDLRATFITQMLLQGAALAQVMSIVGHCELKTTNAYLRVTGKDLDGATEKLSYTLPGAKLGELIEFRAQKEA